MKKLALLLAALLALLSLAPALADAAEAPILFRGIEWGTSAEELSDGYIIESKSKNPHAVRHVSLDEYAYPDESSFTRKCESGSIIAPNAQVGEIGDVAGYRLLDITLYFVHVPEADGSFAEDWSSWQLYAAQYNLSSEMIDPDIEGIDILEDLTGKLSALYGDYEDEEGYWDCRIWRGAEGTYVALTVIPGGETIYITYSYDGADAQLAQAQAAVDAINAARDAKKEAFSQQTNGL